MPIAYEITAPSGAKAFLFGTFHLPTREYNLTSEVAIEVTSAFDKAQYVMFEADTDPQICQDASEQWAILKAEWKSKHLSDEQNMYCDLSGDQIKILKRYGYTKGAIKQMTPEECIGLLIPGVVYLSENPVGIDERLMRLSRLLHKEIDFMESLIEQFKLLYMYNYTYAEQLEMYRYRYANEDQSATDESIASYDAQKFNSDILWPQHSGVPKIAKTHFNDVICKRDHAMAEKIQTKMAGKDVSQEGFIAVGALHLEGITSRLNTVGYAVKPIHLHLAYELPFEKAVVCYGQTIALSDTQKTVLQQIVMVRHRLRSIDYTRLYEDLQMIGHMFSSHPSLQTAEREAIRLGYMLALHQFKVQMKQHSKYKSENLEEFIQTCTIRAIDIFKKAHTDSKFHLTSALSKMVMSEARSHFRNDYKILRILADILMVFLMPLGAIVAGVKYHLTGNASFYFFKTNREKMLQDNVRKFMPEIEGDKTLIFS